MNVLFPNGNIMWKSSKWKVNTRNIWFNKQDRVIVNIKKTDTNTIRNIIQEHIRPGWAVGKATYQKLHNFNGVLLNTHKTVKHSRNFVDLYTHAQIMSKDTGQNFSM